MGFIAEVFVVADRCGRRGGSEPDDAINVLGLDKRVKDPEGGLSGSRSHLILVEVSAERGDMLRGNARHLIKEGRRRIFDEFVVGLVLVAYVLKIAELALGVAHDAIGVTLR